MTAADPPLRILTAEWIAPMQPTVPRPVRGYGVVVSHGEIKAFGPLEELNASTPSATIEDLGDAILMPGLVNAHVHLELSDAVAGDPPAGGFGAWLLGVIRHTAGAGAALPEQVRAAVERGVQQCLRFGVTSVGDISRQCALTRPVLRNGPLRVTSYGEIQAMGKRRHLFDERLTAAMDESQRSRWLALGITPHAPYTVEPQFYTACETAAYARGLPLATHLAESPDEATFLAEHRGPFRELWDAIGAWDDAVPTFSGGPIRFAQSLGLLDYPTLLAHVNYCDDEELKILAQGNARLDWRSQPSVVYCPRTHRYFGHPPHRWREMQAMGINVALGTDSCASSPNLNLVDDLRLVHEQSPEVPSHVLWKLVTTHAAQAIRTGSGTLSAGHAADLVAFPAAREDPLLAILESDMLPRAVWIGGTRFEDEHLHPKPDAASAADAPGSST